MPQTVALLMEEVSIHVTLFSSFVPTEGNYALHTHTWEDPGMAAAERLLKLLEISTVTVIPFEQS